MQTGIDRNAMTASSEFVVVDNGVANQEWRLDFARLYAARESCTSDQAGRAASILCESLCLLPPLDAVGIISADRDLLAALRVATREAREDLQSAYPDAVRFSPVAHRT